MAEVGFYEGSYGDYIVGTESVKVPAGTYMADHILIEDIYVAEERATIHSPTRSADEWWISDEVPGELVSISGRIRAMEPVCRAFLSPTRKATRLS